MAVKVGRTGKVTLGSTKILGLGAWNISGLDADQLEDTEFGDNVKTYIIALRDGGTVSFDGYYDPADTSDGQEDIRKAFDNGTLVTSLRFYEDATSYWYISNGGLVTAGGGIYITSYEIGADKGGLISCSFSGKVSGLLYVTQ